MFMIFFAEKSPWALNYFGEPVSLAPLVSCGMGR
jgi:hypothetical protein